MEKNTVKEIINALKRLIYELKNGFCENLSNDQIKKIENGFREILSVEKEIIDGNDRLHADMYHNRLYSWRNFICNVLSFKKKGNEG